MCHAPWKAENSVPPLFFEKGGGGGGGGQKKITYHNIWTSIELWYIVIYVFKENSEQMLVLETEIANICGLYQQLQWTKIEAYMTQSYECCPYFSNIMRKGHLGVRFVILE